MLPIYDVDGSGEVTFGSDTLLILKYIVGMRGDGLIVGVVEPDATRTTAKEIEAYIETIWPKLDANGDGRVDIADGFLILKYVVGLRGTNLVTGGVISGHSTRNTAEKIGAYIEKMIVTIPEAGL